MVKISRISTQQVRTKPAEPSRNPFSAAIAKAATPVQVARKSIIPSISNMDDSVRGHIVEVDNEVSFNIGASKTPNPKSVSKTAQMKKSVTRKVPDFKRMHSAQFSAQKSITHAVVRVCSVCAF